MKVFYHKGCFDGMTAAWVMKTWDSSAELFPVQYPAEGSPEDIPPFEDGEELWIVDFTYKAETLVELCKRAKRVVVVDHHERPIKAVHDYFQKNPAPENLVCVFATDRSGAALVWDTVYPTRRGSRPFLVEAVNDHDRFVFQRPDTHEVIAALGTKPFTFEAYSEFSTELYSTILSQGRAIMAYRDGLLDYHLRSSLSLQLFCGYLVPVANAPHPLASHLAKKMYEEWPTCPFAVVWSLENGGEYRFSLRTEKGRFDVSAIAEQFGGNGHPGAAGFRVSKEKFVELI